MYTTRSTALIIAAGCMLSAASFAATTPNATPVNLDTVKHELVIYHDSGKYNQQIATQIQKGLTYLKQQIAKNNKASDPKKLAVILDIDETSLSNYPDMKHYNFGGSAKDFNNAMEQAHDPAITPTKALYKYAVDHNVTVFFVTGRPELMRKQTTENLRKQGYTKWQKLYMRPNDYAQRSIVPYKSSTRKMIAGKGYDIVLNVGDQESDLKGGFAEKTVKVPDPYYFIG